MAISSNKYEYHIFVEMNKNLNSKMILREHAVSGIKFWSIECKTHALDFELPELYYA